jgi:hypothetical protein
MDYRFPLDQCLGCWQSDWNDPRISLWRVVPGQDRSTTHSGSGNSHLGDWHPHCLVLAVRSLWRHPQWSLHVWKSLPGAELWHDSDIDSNLHGQ